MIADLKNLFARTKLYIVMLLAALVVVTWALVIGSSAVSSDRTPVRVVISQGSSARIVAGTLQDNHLIRSPFVFLLTCMMSGASEKLKPGVYELNRAMTAQEIIGSLVEGKTLESWVTIPEGKTLREIADILKAKQLADPTMFLTLTTAQNDSFASYSFLSGSSLEGYLFPDTYLIQRGSTADDDVSKMLDTFNKKVVRAHRAEIEQVIQKRFGLGEDSFPEGLNKILTIASMVEREAKVPADRPKIAAVIFNRLAKGMKLEIDATVTYRLGKSRANKPRILYSDLAVDSPYNTYKYAGLPPAPICNPGLASIKAVLEPAAIDSLYYVAKKDGSHVFSTTLQQHDADVKAIKEGKL